MKPKRSAIPALLALPWAQRISIRCRPNLIWPDPPTAPVYTNPDPCLTTPTGFANSPFGLPAPIQGIVPKDITNPSPTSADLTNVHDRVDEMNQRQVEGEAASGGRVAPR